MRATRSLLVALLGNASLGLACGGDDGSSNPAADADPDPAADGAPAADAAPPWLPGFAYDFRFQQGYDGYDGTTDTCIRESEPVEDAGTISDLPLENADTHPTSWALFRFDISALAGLFAVDHGDPCDERLLVDDATLTVYGYGQPKNGLSSRMLKSGAPIFDEADATWDDASAEEPWDVTIEGELRIWNDLDFATLGVASTPDDVAGVHYPYPIVLDRETVQRWMCHPDDNAGLVIGVAGDPLNPFNLTSSEIVPESYRPSLLVTVKYLAP